MHRSCRTAFARFLVNNLLTDWRIGELIFARHLLDYDPASNSFGWQGMASVGVSNAASVKTVNPETIVKSLLGNGCEEYCKSDEPH